MASTALDAADIRILCALQKHGQLSKTQLAELVGLSSTPCLARLTRLKAAGYIRGYHADIALERLGDVTQVVMTVGLRRHRKIDFDRFEARIRRLEEVTECLATGGGVDYVLKAVCADMASFQTLMDNLLEEDCGIDRYVTYFVTRTIKSSQPDIGQLAEKLARKAAKTEPISQQR